MDEVLAVGDMAFQKKCIEKMNQVSKDEGRTILYVSHNMNTIRQLCNRVVVLDHGKVIFNGDVEEGIGIYLQKGQVKLKKHIDCLNKHVKVDFNNDLLISQIDIINSKDVIYQQGEKIDFIATINSKNDYNKAGIRCVFFTVMGTTVGTSYSNDIIGIKAGDNKIKFSFDTSMLVKNHYKVDIILFTYLKDNVSQKRTDLIKDAFFFDVEKNIKDLTPNWNNNGWGNIRLNNIEVENGNRNS